jgi:lysyl-tRNA synthetase class 2
MSEPNTPESAAPVVDENQVITERRAKLAAIRQRGGPAFPNDFHRNAHAGELHAAYDTEDGDVLAAKNIEVSVAGRMMLKRVMGKASFATLQDGSGQIQLFINDQGIGPEAHGDFKHWDMGDILGARGTVFKTKRGELSVNVTELRLLTKALRPLPEKFHGLTDMEARYRQRYLDLITSEQSRKTFIIRSQVVTTIRAPQSAVWCARSARE